MTQGTPNIEFASSSPKTNSSTNTTVQISPKQYHISIKTLSIPTPKDISITAFCAFLNHIFGFQTFISSPVSRLFVCLFVWFNLAQLLLFSCFFCHSSTKQQIQKLDLIQLWRMNGLGIKCHVIVIRSTVSQWDSLSLVGRDESW